MMSDNINCKFNSPTKFPKLYIELTATSKLLTDLQQTNQGGST